MEMTFQNLCAFSRGQNSGHRLQVQARSKKRKKKKRKLQKKNKTCVAAKAHASGRRSPICPGSLVRVGLLLKEKKKASKKKQDLCCPGSLVRVGSLLKEQKTNMLQLQRRPGKCLFSIVYVYI